MKLFDPNTINTKFLFFTGKGGVGKTSTACATAISMADKGKKVLLISTDPASNLQDVFGRELNNKGVAINEVSNLTVANLDPIQAAAEYRNKVVEPYRGVLPDEVIANMEEQLSGSCTVEIAAFNEFAHFMTDDELLSKFDHVIFDTAPTGHTLRMLELPSAWNDFIASNKSGASCLGQLSGLQEQKEKYEQAVKSLGDARRTTLVLVSRPENAPLKEAMRASSELMALNVKNQVLILNGVMAETLSHNDKDLTDAVAKALVTKQRNALASMPEELKSLPTSYVCMQSFNMDSIKSIREMLTPAKPDVITVEDTHCEGHSLDEVVNSILDNGRKIIFTMGKGGVGKTTVAASIALRLAKMGKDVHLTTTDPAAHLKFVMEEGSHLTMSVLDEKEALLNYQQEVLTNARNNGISEDDINYIKEDLRSPCTQEIAVFKAFAQLVERNKDRVMVIDTAPTGHTLLLLSSTESYDKEISRSKGDTPQAVKDLLPRITSDETEVIIVTLPEATPYYEAERLESDLKRAHMNVGYWVVNGSIMKSNTSHPLLKAKAQHETPWINKVSEHTHGKMCLIDWKSYDVSFDKLLDL